MKYLIFAASILLAGCSTNMCRAPDTVANLTPSKSTFVYKYDGSLQCGLGKEITLGQMEKELGSIKILSKTKNSDGLSRNQVCGASTGKINVFEIPIEKLQDATKLGFEEYTK